MGERRHRAAIDVQHVELDVQVGVEICVCVGVVVEEVIHGLLAGFHDAGVGNGLNGGCLTRRDCLKGLGQAGCTGSRGVVVGLKGLVVLQFQQQRIGLEDGGLGKLALLGAAVGVPVHIHLAGEDLGLGQRDRVA